MKKVCFIFSVFTILAMLAVVPVFAQNTSMASGTGFAEANPSMNLKMDSYSEGTRVQRTPGNVQIPYPTQQFKEGRDERNIVGPLMYLDWMAANIGMSYERAANIGGGKSNIWPESARDKNLSGKKVVNIPAEMELFDILRRIGYTGEVYQVTPVIGKSTKEGNIFQLVSDTDVNIMAFDGNIALIYARTKGESIDGASNSGGASGGFSNLLTTIFGISADASVSRTSGSVTTNGVEGIHAIGYKASLSDAQMEMLIKEVKMWVDDIKEGMRRYEKTNRDIAGLKLKIELAKIKREAQNLGIEMVKNPIIPQIGELKREISIVPISEKARESGALNGKK